MKKHIPKFYLLLILALGLTGCGLAAPTIQPTQIERLPSPTVNSPLSTLVPTPIPSLTLTPLATVEQPPSPTHTPTITMTTVDTLEPEKADETIKTLLREPVDCAAPCFWGIAPGHTTTGEARNIFGHFGLQMASKTYEGKDYSSIHYVLDSGLSLAVILTTQDNIVENIQIKITPENQKIRNPQEWSAYSIDTLIKRYGIPSRVDFSADWGPGPYFEMDIFYDSIDLIVQYTGDNIIPSQKGSSQICPLTAQFDSAWLWMGENPKDPPLPGVPLENVTSLTLEEFSKLMTGDPNQACFIFNGNAIR